MSYISTVMSEHQHTLSVVINNIQGYRSLRHLLLLLVMIKISLAIGLSIDSSAEWGAIGHPNIKLYNNIIKNEILIERLMSKQEANNRTLSHLGFLIY
jgi:hypothetical protein